MVLQSSHFNEIQKALEKYRAESDELKSELRDSTNDSDTIRQELNDARYCIMDVSKASKCFECRDGVLYPAKKQLFDNKQQEVLLPNKFYSFSCGHYFHANCLCALTLSLLTAKQSILKKLGLTETEEDVLADLFEDKSKEYDYMDIEKAMQERLSYTGKLLDFQKELSDYCVLDEFSRKYRFRNKAVDIKRSKLSKLQRKISMMQSIIHRFLNDKDKAVQSELDELIGKNCPYDSRLFVDLIQLPIIEDNSLEGSSWEITKVIAESTQLPVANATTTKPNATATITKQ